MAGKQLLHINNMWSKGINFYMGICLNFHTFLTTFITCSDCSPQCRKSSKECSWCHANTKSHHKSNFDSVETAWGSLVTVGTRWDRHDCSNPMSAQSKACDLKKRGTFFKSVSFSKKVLNLESKSCINIYKTWICICVVTINVYSDLLCIGGDLDD